ncbi:unnamed protein product, partial [marine sediment metagenome]
STKEGIRAYGQGTHEKEKWKMTKNPLKPVPGQREIRLK